VLACHVHPVGFIDLSYGVKCDACPVKFEVRKYFTREGAYFTVGAAVIGILLRSPPREIVAKPLLQSSISQGPFRKTVTKFGTTNDRLYGHRDRISTDDTEIFT
jgi:hypothetical protein